LYVVHSARSAIIGSTRVARGDERRDEGHDRDERGDGVAGRRIARAPTPKSVF